MKISKKIIEELTGLTLPATDELVARLNAQLGGVEEIIELGERYAGARIVQVVSVSKHPNADKLSVCLVDDGGVVPDVPRDEDRLVQVVCGAPNVHDDMWAVWLPPATVVPSSVADGEPFVLDARPLRGVLSQGMLAAGDELGINDDHDGIIELTERDLPHGQQLVAGASFAEVFSLDDTIIDIENKMFTHRPDCFGQLGVAREISAILGGVTTPDEGVVDTRYENPDWYWTMPEFESASRLELETFNDAGDHVPRVMFVAMDNVEIKPSPLWLQCRLVAMGSKAINNVVDATNYVMLMTAQPTHAYDYDKLRGHKIGARMAKQGEKLLLLNGKTYELETDDIVIADGEGAIGLGGIMGGGNSEVSGDTTRIVLEVATFDMYAVRKSSMRHGVFTDALTRFNKGQSPLQNNRVMKFLMTMIQELSPAQQASAVADLGIKNWNQADSLSGEIAVNAGFINDRLGSDLTVAQIGNLLRRVNFASTTSETDANTLCITAPFWRTDIDEPEDIVEEVGRLYGFDKLPRHLPQRSAAPAATNAMLALQQRVRQSLSRAGASEVLTYSFVHEQLLARAGQDVSQAFKLSNALSPDLQYYRLSVLPSLLDRVHANIKLGFDEFVLFELGKAHNKKYHADDDEGLPREIQMIDAVYASKTPREGAALYHVRRLLDQLAHDLRIDLVYKSVDEELDYPLTAPFEQSRSALVETTGGVFIGMIGELKSTVRKGFKLPEYTAAMSLDTEGLLRAADRPTRVYRPLSRFPSLTQDVSLVVPADTKFADVMQTASLAIADADELDVELSPVTIYQADDADTKSITVRLRATHHSQTLTDADVTPLIDRIVAVAADAHQAVRG